MKYNKKVLVDPKPQNFLNYVGATSMTPNRKEILDYFGMKKFTSEEQIAEKMAQLKDELKLDSVVLTRSEEGVSLFKTKHKRIPTVAREVYDVTGAGDSFSSGVLYGSLKGASLEESIGYGLTNSYYTVQAIETVRKDLNAKSFEKEYQQLKERGLS